MLFFHVLTESPETDMDDVSFAPPIQHDLIAVAILKIEDSGKITLKTLKTSKTFFNLLKDGPRIVSWNGRGFGIPVLAYDAVKRRQSIENLRSGPPYLNRYNDAHIDLADQMAFRGAASRVSLDQAVGRLLGFPGRLFKPEETDLATKLAALEIDVALLALVYCRWYCSADDSFKKVETSVRRVAVARCKKRLKGKAPQYVKKYIAEFQRVG